MYKDELNSFTILFTIIITLIFTVYISEETLLDTKYGVLIFNGFVIIYNILGDVSCFGHDCYMLAFGVPAVLMILSLGKYKFYAFYSHFAILMYLPRPLKKEKEKTMRTSKYIPVTVLILVAVS